MKLLRWGLTTGLCGILLTATAARQQESDPLALARRAVLTGSDAYVALPPDMITGPQVEQVAPSPSGNYLLIERVVPKTLPTTKSLSFESTKEPERAEVDLLLWDVVRRRVSTIWKGSLTPTQFSVADVVGWLPGSDTALIHIASGQTDALASVETLGDFGQLRLALVDAARGTTRTLAVVSPKDTILISAHQPVAALISDAEHTVRVIRSDGTLGRTLPLTETDIAWMGWREDGKTIYGIKIPRRTPINKEAPQTPVPRPIPSTGLLDTQTGVVTIQEGRPDRKWFSTSDTLIPTNFPIKVNLGTTKMQEGDRAETVHPLWLQGTAPDAQGRALIAADATKPLLLPSVVIYQNQGVLFAAPLIKMDRSAFLDARQKAYKQATMMRGKQIALGMLMYCQDYDENFPPPGTDMDTISPYLKNKDVFNNPETGQFGLQMVYKQSSLTGFQAPATDVMGYLSGPGGRAVIYVDGHVKWEDK